MYVPFGRTSEPKYSLASKERNRKEKKRSRDGFVDLFGIEEHD